MPRKIGLAALLITLLVWSYFARPVYDFARIAAGRVWDAQVEKHARPFLRQNYRSVMDAATEQAAEINQYFNVQRRTAANAPAIRQLDFSGEANYVRSTDALRDYLRGSLGFFPESVAPPTEPVQETPLGEDDLATYTRLRVQVTPGIHSIGVYMRPKNRPGKLPLVIAAHGRSGPPERVADGKVTVLAHHNRDLGRGALERGYAVWEPMFVFYAQGQPEDLRERLSARALEAGTTLPAVEILKTVRTLDALLQRPEIDPARVAMVGMSYGGFYTLYTTALEPRIKVAVVAAYFNDREAVLDASEPAGFSDWRFPDSLTLLRDPFIAALVCPRALEIQAGSQDQLFPVEGARRTVPEAARFYERLGCADRFKFVDFVGRHDFNGREAWDFLGQHL